jgi:hypothetical protein
MDKTVLTESLNKIQTELKAPKGQKNSFGNYNYRSCEDILEAVKPLLKETNTVLLITDELVQVGDRYYIKATAGLCLGDDSIKVTAYARECENKKGMDESQITGSTSSYARKYALNGLFCIDDTKDADATNKHEDKPRETKKPKATKESTTSLKDMCVELGKKKFSDADEFKLWRVDNGLAEKLSEASELELSKLKLRLDEHE